MIRFANLRRFLLVLLAIKGQISALDRTFNGGVLSVVQVVFAPCLPKCPFALCVGAACRGTGRTAGPSGDSTPPFTARSAVLAGLEPSGPAGVAVGDAAAHPGRFPGRSHTAAPGQSVRSPVRVVAASRSGRRVPETGPRPAVKLARVPLAVEEDVGPHPGHQLRSRRLGRPTLPGDGDLIEQSGLLSCCDRRGRYRTLGVMGSLLRQMNAEPARCTGIHKLSPSASKKRAGSG